MLRSGARADFVIGPACRPAPEGGSDPAGLTLSGQQLQPEQECIAGLAQDLAVLVVQREAGAQARLVFASFPEVTQVISQAGRPDDGTDTGGFGNTEFFCELKPKGEWRPVFHENKEALIAAMNVTTGTVQHAIITRNDSTAFTAFLAQLEASVPDNLDIHLVLDNGSSHTSKATKAWLALHPRFHTHHTPVHSSWLNMIEIWFSILTSKVLRRGEFTSREHLAAKIDAFVTHYNTTARPFRWTYDARPLQAA